MSTKGGSGGGGKVHPDGESSMAVSWLGCEKLKVVHFSFYA